MQEKVISNKKQLSRFCEFDFMKAIAVIGLPAVHLMEEAILANLVTDGLLLLESIIVGLCVIGPSVFMMCMGFGLGGTVTTPKKLFTGGYKFILIGLLLNVFRWIIPGTMQLIITGDSLKNEILLFIQSDIYIFVGLFYIFLALMRKMKVSTFGVFLISLLMLTTNTILTPTLNAHITNEYVYSYLGNYIYINGTSYFPLMTWAIFPTVGMLLAEYLKKIDDTRKDIFMKRSLALSAVILFSFTVFLAYYGVELEKVYVSPANSYITDLPNVILLVTLAFLMFSLSYYLCKIIGSSKFMSFMLKISTFIVPFYLLQWVLVAWLVYILRDIPGMSQNFGVFWYIISSALITAVCTYVATRHGMKCMRLLTRITSFKKRKRKKN